MEASVFLIASVVLRISPFDGDELSFRLARVSLEDTVFVDNGEVPGLLFFDFLLLWSSEVGPVFLLPRTIANSSSSGTASSSSSLGNRSPLELSEFVVDLEFAVPLRFLPCLPRPTLVMLSSLSSIKGSASLAPLPTFSCRSAADGRYLTLLPPIFHGSRSRKPNIDDFGTILGSVPPSRGIPKVFLLATPVP